MDSQAQNIARRTDRDSHASRQSFGGARPTEPGQTAERIVSRSNDAGDAMADRGPVFQIMVLTKFTHNQVGSWLRHTTVQMV